jgi:hypothetical protein
MNAKLPSKRDLKFLLAEDVRPEMGGKFSLVGLIPGERIAIQGEPPPGVAFAIPSLSFVFILAGPSAGTFKGRFRIVAPDKKTIVSDVPLEKPIQKPAGKASMFAAAAKPFAGPAFGTYSVQLDLGKVNFRFPVTVEKGFDTSKQG